MCQYIYNNIGFKLYLLYKYYSSAGPKVVIIIVHVVHNNKDYIRCMQFITVKIIILRTFQNILEQYYV